MKITEIIWEDGKRYRDKDGREWKIVDNELYNDKYDIELRLSSEYSLKEITQMNFTEVINWSKVKVDTPVWCQNGLMVYPLHFSHYKDEMVMVFANGKTSHSGCNCDVEQWYSTRVSLIKPD